MSPRPDAPLSALWRPTALAAVVFAGEALAIILALAPAQSTSDRLVVFGLASLGIQWVTLGTLCALYLLRHQLARLPAPRAAWTCLALFLAMTLLVSLAGWGLLEQNAGIGHRRADFLLRMVALALVVGLIGLLTYRNYWRARHMAVRAKQSELEALQARVRPHFLFNTLNSGIALVRQHPEQAEELLLGLSELFRAALARPHDVPLAQELALVRRYLEIEAVRFGLRLQVAWRLPDPMPEVAVPALSIQALVENAVRHGIERLPDGGIVRIEVVVVETNVEVTVHNPVTAGNTRTSGHSIGLQATRARVEASTGGRGSVESGREGEAFVARMRLPLV